jgi:hypothetical protein
MGTRAIIMSRLHEVLAAQIENRHSLFDRAAVSQSTRINSDRQMRSKIGTLGITCNQAVLAMPGVIAHYQLIGLVGSNVSVNASFSQVNTYGLAVVPTHSTRDR